MRKFLQKLSLADSAYAAKEKSKRNCSAFLSLSIWSLLLGLAFESSSLAAKSARNMVASVHPIATDAGVQRFAEGGNAVDAAVAAALTLGVVDGHNSGIGGSAFILVRTPDGRFHAIDGREMAPAKASRDMYVKNGVVNVEASQTGALAAAVPGALAAYREAVATFGKQPLKKALLSAAGVAERGFSLDRIYARNLLAVAPRLQRFEGTRAVLLKSGGLPYAAGETLRQPDLAKTYRSIAEQGSDWFYKGPFAIVTEAWMKENGGIITAGDFANYKIERREPLITEYRGHTIVGFPPPSSGGVHIAQMLNILEHFDVKKIYEQNQADFVHLVAEAMKLAFADRAFWLGDPDHARVPRGLASRAYAAQLAKKIDVVRATRVPQHGSPPHSTTDIFTKHTTHVTAADADGTWVAITTTINTSFGSKVIVPGTGVLLNNQMDDFSLQPGVPNSFGLLGAEANSIAPGKRPLSSMSPTIVLKDGKPILTVGAAGGPTIISQVLLAILRHVDLGMPVEQALSSPRFHHQWSPDRLVMEDVWPEDVVEELRKRGHDVQRRATIGVSQGISWSAAEQVFFGAFDPRVPGKAAGSEKP